MEQHTDLQAPSSIESNLIGNQSDSSIQPEVIATLPRKEKRKRKRGESSFSRRLVRATSIVMLIGIPIAILTFAVMLQMVGVINVQAISLVDNRINRDEVPLCSESLRTQPWIEDSINSGSSLYGPQKSPDGRYMAYLKQNDPKMDIYLKDTVLNTEQQVTSGDGKRGYRSPYWSPDSKAIAFDKSGPSISDIYVYEIGSNEPHLVVQGYASVSGWSPDSKSIIYTFADQNARGINIADAHSGQVLKNL